jgi:hypothetical protein
MRIVYAAAVVIGFSLPVVQAADMAAMATGAAKDSASNAMMQQGVDKAVDAGAGMAKEQITKQAAGAAGDAAAASGLSASQAQAAHSAVDSGAGMAKQAAKGVMN